MTDPLPVDPNSLREEVKSKYREVAQGPHGKFHFHTGRRLAKRLRYPDEVVDPLPDAAVESRRSGADPGVSSIPGATRWAA